MRCLGSCRVSSECIYSENIGLDCLLHNSLPWSSHRSTPYVSELLVGSCHNFCLFRNCLEHRHLLKMCWRWPQMGGWTDCFWGCRWDQANYEIWMAGMVMARYQCCWSRYRRQECAQAAGSLSIWEGSKEEGCMLLGCNCSKRIQESVLEMDSAIFRRTSKYN